MDGSELPAGGEAELDTLVIRVRADTRDFLSGIGDIQRELNGPLAAGAERAGGSIERALARAAVSGKFGFEDLRRVALTALADIASNALRADLGGLFGGGGGGGGLGGLVAGLFGAPGRAIGGPVAPGRPFLVGERGPELFVPASAGRVEARGSPMRGPVNVTINVAAPRDAAPALMMQTGAQVARAVRQALARVE